MHPVGRQIPQSPESNVETTGARNIRPGLPKMPCAQAGVVGPFFSDKRSNHEILGPARAGIAARTVIAVLRPCWHVVHCGRHLRDLAPKVAVEQIDHSS